MSGWPRRGGWRRDRPSGRATERELAVVAAVLEAGSEKAAAYQLGLSHSTGKHHLSNARLRIGVATTAQLVWILASRLPEPEGASPTDRCGRDGLAIAPEDPLGVPATTSDPGRP